MPSLARVLSVGQKSVRLAIRTRRDHQCNRIFVVSPTMSCANNADGYMGRLMRFPGLIGLERCRSFVCSCSDLSLEHNRTNAELCRPQGR